MNDLYCKYVNEDTADFEVNISARRRRAIKNAYEIQKDKRLAKILQPMEKSVLEISSLLNDSRGRFREQAVFTELAIQLSKSASTSTKSPWSPVKAKSEDEIVPIYSKSTSSI